MPAIRIEDTGNMVAVTDPAYASYALEELFGGGLEPAWSTETEELRDRVAAGLPDKYVTRAYESWTLAADVVGYDGRHRERECEHPWQDQAEIGLTDECDYGCKVLECGQCGAQATEHRAAYGHPIGRSN